MVEGNKHIASGYRRRLGSYVQRITGDQYGLGDLEQVLNSGRDFGLTDAERAALEFRLQGMGYLDVGKAMGLEGKKSTVRAKATRLVKGGTYKIFWRI